MTFGGDRCETGDTEGETETARTLSLLYASMPAYLAIFRIEAEMVHINRKEVGMSGKFGAYKVG